MGELLRRYALPTADFQAPVGRYRPDFLWPTEMVILECDGWGTHGRDRAVFERDRERDAWLHAAGYVVWRFTWMQISQRQAWVADRIGCGLAVRRVQLGLGADLGVVIPE